MGARDPVAGFCSSLCLHVDVSDINARVEIQEFTAQIGLPCKRLVHLLSNLRGCLLSRCSVQTVRDGEV